MNKYHTAIADALMAYANALEDPDKENGLDEAIAAIDKAVLEHVIGEDDFTKDAAPNLIRDELARNYLRHSQRTIITEDTK